MNGERIANRLWVNQRRLINSREAWITCLRVVALSEIQATPAVGLTVAGTSNSAGT